MDKEFEKHKTISRRSFIIGAIQLGATAGLASRLAYLQLVEGDRYKTLSDKNSINLRLVPPSRGIIYDRNKKVLAGNTQNFKLLITPEQVNDIDVLLEKLSKQTKITQSMITQFKEQAQELPKFVSVELKSGLDWETVSKIEVNAIEFPGVKIEMGDQRHYPLEKATAHIVGYVSAINKTDMQENPELKRLPHLKIGKTGIEKKFDPYLRGSPGSRKIEINVSGRQIRELEKINSKSGETLVLSLDSGLQDFVNKKLAKHKSASAVVMDAKTGAVYALGSYPGFDPNLFVKGLDMDSWQSLLSDPAYPLTNKAVSGQYPPGSTFKMVTALAALEAGITDKRRKVNCVGHYDLGRDRFHCWKRGGHGSMDMVQALAQSCDVYFYEVARELGIDKIAEMSKRLGLGSVYDFELSEERAGLIPDTAWKYAHLGTKWQPGETVVASIGQGYIQTTPLQLAVMTARLVNGGYAVKPWIVHSVGPYIRPPKTWPKLKIKKSYLDLVNAGMDEAVNGKKGTALGSRIYEDGFTMAGKTGTAQVRRITKAQRASGIKQEELPWKHRHHALFVGYGPVKDPRYICATVIEHGIGGSKTAAPLTKEILLETQKRAPADNEIYVPEGRFA